MSALTSVKGKGLHGQKDSQTENSDQTEGLRP